MASSKEGYRQVGQQFKRGFLAEPEMGDVEVNQAVPYKKGQDRS